MATCQNCGHIFSTHVQVTQSPALHQTQVVPTMSSPGREVANKALVFGSLGAFVIVGLWIAYKFAVGNPLAGTWVQSDAIPGTYAGIILVLRKDGTGELQTAQMGSQNPSPQNFRPLAWHTEGSIFFLEPVDVKDINAPIMYPYKLFDSNRYLALKLEGSQGLWRRREP